MNVPTYICARPDDCAFVVDHLDELVVKAVNESGGYGMLMGLPRPRRNAASSAKNSSRPTRNYIAQPVVTLSVCPTWTDDGLEAPATSI